MFPKSKSFQKGEDQLNIIWKCIMLAFLYFHFFRFKYDSLGHLKERTLTFSHFRKTKWNGSQRILIKPFCRVLNPKQQEVQNSSKEPGELHVLCFLCPLYTDSQACTLSYHFLSTALLLYNTQIVSAAAGQPERERQRVVLNDISW